VFAAVTPEVITIKVAKALAVPSPQPFHFNFSEFKRICGFFYYEINLIANKNLLPVSSIPSPKPGASFFILKRSPFFRGFSWRI
jgi:hypothetical protein